MASLKFVGFTAKNNFGIEIEVNKSISQAAIRDLIRLVDSRDVQVTGWGNTRNNHYWHVKTDSTCGDLGKGKDDGGWEIASFVARGPKDLKLIGEVVRTLYRGGAKVNNNCGLHIHVDIGKFSWSEFQHLVSRWLQIEHLFYEIVPPNRRKNVYCMPLRQKMKINKSDLYINDYQLEEKCHLIAGQKHGRRAAFNICNYVNADIARTVELRLPEGTLDYSIVKHWVRLFIHFVFSSKINVEPTSKGCFVGMANLNDALSILGLQGNDKFYILSKHLRLTKIWFLKRVLEYSENNLLRQNAKEILCNII